MNFSERATIRKAVLGIIDGATNNSLRSSAQFKIADQITSLITNSYTLKAQDEEAAPEKLLQLDQRTEASIRDIVYRAAEEMTERLYNRLRLKLVDDTVKIVHTEVREKLGDELQTRIPQIAQAVLECDVRDYASRGDALSPALREAANVAGCSERLSLLVSASVAQSLDQLAAARGTTRAGVVRQLLMEGVQKTVPPATAPPKVARADIPADYEYDPSTDSYRRGRVLTVAPAGGQVHSVIEGYGTLVIRNVGKETIGVLVERGLTV